MIEGLVLWSTTIKGDVIRLHRLVQWAIFVDSIIKKCSEMIAYGTPPNVFLPTIDERYTELEVCENAKARKAMLTWWIAVYTLYRSETSIWIQNTQAIEVGYPALLANCLFFENQDLARRYGISDSIKRDDGSYDVFLKSKTGDSQCADICHAIAALAAEWEIPIDAERVDLDAIYERYHGGAGS